MLFGADNPQVCNSVTPPNRYPPGLIYTKSGQLGNYMPDIYVLFTIAHLFVPLVFPCLLIPSSFLPYSLPSSHLLLSSLYLPIFTRSLYLFPSTLPFFLFLFSLPPLLTLSSPTFFFFIYLLPFRSFSLYTPFAPSISIAV